jgi:hypothetical protein
MDVSGKASVTTEKVHGVGTHDGLMSGEMASFALTFIGVRPIRMSFFNARNPSNRHVLEVS